MKTKEAFSPTVLTVALLKRRDAQPFVLLQGKSVCEDCAQTPQTVFQISLPLFSVGHSEHVKSGSKVENEVHLTLYCAKKGLMCQPCPTVGCLFQCIKAAVLSCDSTKLSQMNQDTRLEKEHISLLK